MTDVIPKKYKIHLEPDLQDFRFFGSTEIFLEAIKPVSEITLNILELAIWNCKAWLDEEFVVCPFYVNPKKEGVTISLPKETPGNIKIKIDYMGHINDKMAGFYRSSYESEGMTKYIAVTQFEESDARRAFPCLDHPIQKAIFEIEMIVDEGLVALSNSPITEERPVRDGKKLIKFQETPKMSTYLVFFGLGEFEFTEDKGDVLMRAATMPGMKKYARFGLEFGRKSLEFCEEYYGIEYPLPKLDLISIPDFAFGAMENWGAITFRENLLLCFPEITSKAGEERICQVIAHEIVHQWFGNLVTPSDWKYLWLNESFATYFGYGVVSHYFPEWDIWEQFLHGQTDTALERDALHETFSIEIPGGEHVVINASTAPIIYNKGGSILRQVEGYIGSNSFRDGLRRYLTMNEYGCASSRQLWEAFEEVSEKPVTRIMKSWIEQPGFPVVEVKRDGQTLVLTQKRFTYLPNESVQEWIIPIVARIFYRGGKTKSMTMLLDSRQGVLDIGKHAIAYKINDRQTGFYRVKYVDIKNLQELGKGLSSRELPSEDRWGLQNDLYAQVKSDEASINDYLSFLSNYTHEDDFLPLMGIAGNLFHAYLVLENAEREKVASFGKSFFERVLTHIGYEPDANEKHTMSILRDQIILHAVLYGSKDVEDISLVKFTSLMNNETIHPDIIKSVMQVGALNGDDKVFDWFDNRFNASESEHERMNILVAVGYFREKKLIERTQQYTLDNVPNRNKFVPVVSMAANPYAVPDMWDWYRSKLSTLEQFHPLHYERVIAGIIPVCGLGKEDEVKAFFKTYIKQKSMAKDAIKLSLEKLEINCRMRNSRASKP
ncbi:MAG: M1 family metallopeptidase [Desulfobacteraceae bacterium]|nr:MAG: M1 family metallopeptidase [Desulfobacteraceae bacterium]